MHVQLEQVVRRFGQAGSPAAVEVLRGVDLTVACGESVAIVGPSGSGKTTLLQLIGTLDRPDAGRVLLDQRDVTALTPAQLAALRAREIGLVFQEHHLLPQLSVRENVLLPVLALRRRTTRADRERADALLERVGLADRREHRPGELSGGQKQRVAVVRALINQPRLLLADEPTGSLDAVQAGQLAELLGQLNREEHLTLIVVTHAPAVAQRMGRRLRLIDGQLQSEVPPGIPEAPPEAPTDTVHP